MLTWHWGREPGSNDVPAFRYGIACLSCRNDFFDIQVEQYQRFDKL